MANVLQVCREYGRDLPWWDRQTPAHQAIYLGDFRNRQAELKRRIEEAERG